MTNRTAKKHNNKLLIDALTFLAIAFILLIVMIGIISVDNSSTEAELVQESNKITKIGNSAMKKCEALMELHESGVVSMEYLDNSYKRAMEESTEDHYKVYLAVCYADYLITHEGSLDKSVAMVDSIKSFAKTYDDKLTYYNAMIYVYENGGDEDMAQQYYELRKNDLGLNYSNDNINNLDMEHSQE